MSARSLFARQRVESLRWFPRIRLGRPIAKYFGYRPPRLDSVVGRQASRERTTGGTRVNGSIARGCGQHTELWGLPLAASFLWSSLCGDYTFSPAHLTAKLCSVLHGYSLMNEGWRS